VFSLRSVTKYAETVVPRLVAHGLERALEEIDKVRSGRTLKIINGRKDQARWHFMGSDRRPLHIFKRKSGRRPDGMQQQDVVGVNHRSVGSFPVRFPNRPAVKITQRFCARGHIAKTSEPNEAIRMFKVSKLTDDLYSDRLLRLDKFPVEEINQGITLPGMQRVLPQLNDRATEFHLFRISSD
jgi:hypothetical protein